MEKPQVGQVTPQTYQYPINQTGTGLSCTVGGVLLLNEWEQSSELNATALQAIFDLYMHRNVDWRDLRMSVALSG